MKKLLITFLFILYGTSLYADTSRTYIEIYHYGYNEPNLMTKDSSIAFFGLGFQDYGTVDTDSVIATAASAPITSVLARTIILDISSIIKQKNVLPAFVIFRHYLCLSPL